MTHLLNSWKESLGIFKTKHAKLLGLIILKRIQETYLSLAIHFWWFVGPSMCIELICSYQFPALLPHVKSKIVTLWILVVILWARPSNNRKTYAYLMRYSSLILVLGVVKAIYYWSSYIIAQLHYSMINIFMGTISILLIPAALFMAFFYYESNGTVHSLGLSAVRALYLYLYNAPICLLALLFFAACWYVQLFMNPILGTIVVMALIPIPIIIFAVIYTKQLHEQFEFYYLLKSTNGTTGTNTSTGVKENV